MMSPVQAANPVCEGIPLPATGLHDDARIGPQRTRDLDGVVDGVAVDDDELVEAGREPREDVRQVFGLVERRV